MREKAEQEAGESKDTVRIPPLKRDADPCKEKQLKNMFMDADHIDF